MSDKVPVPGSTLRVDPEAAQAFRKRGRESSARSLARKPLSRRTERPRWGIHLKPEPRCRACKAVPAVHLHHAIPRSMNLAAKLDLRNGLPLCGGCHGGWHERRVTIYRDAFTAEEWAFLCSVELIGQNAQAWLDDRYPIRSVDVGDAA